MDIHPDEIVVYQSEAGRSAIDVQLIDKIVCLTQEQIASVIGNALIGLAEARSAITSLKKELSNKGEATDFFGQKRSERLV